MTYAGAMMLPLALIILFGGVGIVIAGMVVLQIFLSKRESKWPGLVLPIINFFFSLLVFLAIFLFTARSTTGTLTLNGVIVEEYTQQITTMPSMIMPAIYVFLLYNIPTAILLAIYAACRGMWKKVQ